MIISIVLISNVIIIYAIYVVMLSFIFYTENISHHIHWIICWWIYLFTPPAFNARVCPCILTEALGLYGNMVRPFYQISGISNDLIQKNSAMYDDLWDCPYLKLCYMEYWLNMVWDYAMSKLRICYVYTLRLRYVYTYAISTSDDATIAASTINT